MCLGSAVELPVRTRGQPTVLQPDVALPCLTPVLATSPRPRRIGVNWSFPALYTPALLPFICVAAATLLFFRDSIPADKSWRDPFTAAAAKCRSVAPAIVGALILVAQMVQGEQQVRRARAGQGCWSESAAGAAWCASNGHLACMLSIPPTPHSSGTLLYYWLLAERVAEARLHCSQRERRADAAGWWLGCHRPSAMPQLGGTCQQCHTLPRGLAYLAVAISRCCFCFCSADASGRRGILLLGLRGHQQHDLRPAAAGAGV